LRSRARSFTLGVVRRVLVFLTLSIWLAAPEVVSAQIPGLGRPPDAIDQARQRALAPIPRTPGVPVPTQQWVPERRFYSPELGRELVVPGHYEGRLSGQQYSVPPMTGYGPQGQNPVAIPGGERPPADLRQGP
jgi:hypothetical protein